MAHIKINNRISTNFKVQLTDVTGKVLYNNFGYASTPDYEYRFDCSSLSSGIYLITLNSNHETLTGKLVKP
ncbi:MAG: T9SS type A sorting domain-containing protein [Bacteroidetes bacterium]|nr:T9SS type A sorting domain-containing protein [Bacteroidota bacterium]